MAILGADSSTSRLPKQRFHISRRFSSDTCQGNRLNRESRDETADKVKKRSKFLIGRKPIKNRALVRDFQNVDKLLWPAQDWLRNLNVTGF